MARKPNIVLLITAIVAIGAALGGGVELPGISINGATAVLGLVSASQAWLGAALVRGARAGAPATAHSSN